MRSEEDRAYLAHKHKGGETNAKGGLYEDCYAVFQIVSCIAKYKASLDGVQEFPDEINNKFLFVTFAIDDERVGSEVIPGVGGMVYPRLGLGNMKEKNHYIPEMVLRKL